MATIYKQGSKGELVKLLQRLLRERGHMVVADGDFGQKTKAAVEALQRSEGLNPVDGIAGPQTLARLCGVDITHAPVNVHITRYNGRPVKYIALHYTAGSTSKPGAAMANRNVFLKREASADFVVDDATIVQVNPNPANYYCWAVGDKRNLYTGGARLNGLARNSTTVSIEMCSILAKGTTAAQPNHEGWSLSAAVVERTLCLVRYLMLMYAVPKENIIRHYDATGKICPGVPGWNDGPLFSTDGKQRNEKSDSSKWRMFLSSI